MKGKYGLPGLPAVYAGEDEAQTLEIDLEDASAKVKVTLFYGVLPELDILTRSARIENVGAGKIYLEKAQAACLDWVCGDFDLICFYGRHAMERNVQRTPVAHGDLQPSVQSDDDCDRTGDERRCGQLLRDVVFVQRKF